MNRSRIDNGSVSVEVVLITPALVVLVLLVVLGGRLTGAQSRVRHAAASAARAASLRSSFEAAAADATTTTAQHDLERAHVECAGGPSVRVEGTVRPGERVTVTVRCLVPLRDLGLLGIGRAVHEVSATSVEVVDVRRSS
jgi:Flp pilus assembly protein TadG